MPRNPQNPKGRKGRFDQSGNFLKRARKLISEGSFDSAEEILESLLEVEPGHQQAQDLLVEIRRNEELSARGARPATSRFGRESGPITVEVASREVEDAAKDKEDTEPELNDEGKSQTGIGSQQEKISVGASVEDATTRPEEAPLSESGETSQEEDFAKDLEPARWLKWRTTETRSATGEMCVVLICYNCWPREIRFQQANIDYPRGVWPPGITELPRRNLAPREALVFHRLRVCTGHHTYHVEVFTVVESTIKKLEATLEITVSNEQFPKVELVEIKCP